MEKNDFLLYNEVVYRIHACRNPEELKSTVLSQINLLIPYSYASFISVEEDPKTHELIHTNPVCKPAQFEAVEHAWLEQIDKAYTIWLSHAPESVVIRDSEILAGDSRFSVSSYRNLYQGYDIHDGMQMNVVYANQVMGRLSFYRTKRYGLFTDQEAFYLRALANHINLSYYTCIQNKGTERAGARGMDEISREFSLTRREEEILGLVFQDMNNEEILQRVQISKNTLLKHLQNLYRKCGVTSRWDLLKLRV